MPTPDYSAFLSGTGASKPWVTEFNYAARVVSRDMSELIKLTGGDPDGINDAIDALMDRCIAAADGDVRLALFGAVTGYGTSMSGLT